MKFKYRQLEKYLKKHGFVNDDKSKYPEAILLMTYKFKNCNDNMINENYKIRILFTKNDNFNIILEIINHPSIMYSENDYGEGVIMASYDSYYMQLYKGICPGYFNTKSIIYYTCSDYIDGERTLLDDNYEFDRDSTNHYLPFMLDRLTISEFEKAIREFVESDNIYKETVNIETSSIIQ